MHTMTAGADDDGSGPQIPAGVFLIVRAQAFLKLSQRLPGVLTENAGSRGFVLVTIDAASRKVTESGSKRAQRIKGGGPEAVEDID